MMNDMTSRDQQEANKRARESALAQARNKIPEASIVSSLVQTGMEPLQARKLVEDVFKELSIAAESQKITVPSLLVALLAAGVAALVGGGIWAAIVIITDYEIGFMSTGIGLLTGFAVVYFSGKRGYLMQAIAVVAALVGIVVGKYVAFFWIFRDIVAEAYGAAAANTISPLSLDMVQVFIEALPDIVSLYDILWIILAVLAAWSFPRGLCMRRARQP